MIAALALLLASPAASLAAQGAPAQEQPPPREDEPAPAAGAGQDRNEAAAEAPDGNVAPDAPDAAVDTADSGDRAAGSPSVLGRWAPVRQAFRNMIVDHYGQQMRDLHERDRVDSYERRRDYLERGIGTLPPDPYAPFIPDLNRVMRCMSDLMDAFADRQQSDPDGAFAAARETAQNCHPASSDRDFNARLSADIDAFVDQHLRPGA